MKKLNVTAAAVLTLLASAIGFGVSSTADAQAGKGYREIYYSDASKTQEVGFMMNRRGCGGDVVIYGTRTGYYTRNAFDCP